MSERKLLQRLLAIISHIGIDPADSAALRLNKQLLVALALMIIPAAILWSAIYLAFDEALAAAIPFSYAMISSASIIAFHFTRRFQWFRFSQMFLMLLLPFLLMLALGGFINGSAVIFWSLLTPIGALVFAGPRQARLWFILYLALILTSGLLQAVVRPTNNLSPTLITIFSVLNIVVPSLIIFVSLYYFITQRNEAYRLLALEQEKSDALLLNVLPKEIAILLKQEPHTIADYHESASVLFADIVGFTPLSAMMTPEAMVELLNEIFSHFDSLVEKYGLEKIRTIGDNYMVASGVPSPQPDHCQALARFALEVRDYMDRRPAHLGHRIQFRIGMNTGPMVAGVIGHHKFHYDVWGDTVNTASRMESHGTAQKIQVTTECYTLLKDQFDFEPRGLVEIKGKGEMEVWYLTGEKDRGQK